MTDHPKMPDEIWVDILNYGVKTENFRGHVKYIRADKADPAPVSGDVGEAIDSWDYLLGEISAASMYLQGGTLENINRIIRAASKPELSLPRLAEWVGSITPSKPCEARGKEWCWAHDRTGEECAKARIPNAVTLAAIEGASRISESPCEASMMGKNDMTNVIKLPALWHADLDAESMLTAIASDKPKHAFVIIWPEDGSMPTYHSNTSDTPVVVYRIQEFLHKLYGGEFK